MFGRITFLAFVLEKLLRRFSGGEPDRDGIGQEARLALAERGDPTCTARFLKALQKLSGHTLAQHEHGCAESFGLFIVLKALLKSRPRGLEAALRGVVQTPCPDVRLEMSGALAVLGDRAGLDYVRQQAANRDYSQSRLYSLSGPRERRAHALEWLALAKDRASLAVVDAAVQDEEDEVRESAERASKLLRR